MKPSFEPFAHDVYSWAYRLLGRHHDALDVVQDVYLKWDAKCGSEAPTQPRGWLRRVTVNRSIDALRRRSNELSLRVVPQSVAETATDGGLDLESLRADVASAMDKLTDAQRGVLVAKVYDTMTFAEIAEEQQLSVSTIKTHYLRAVRAVRDRLRRRWGSEDES